MLVQVHAWVAPLAKGHATPPLLAETLIAYVFKGPAHAPQAPTQFTATGGAAQGCSEIPGKEPFPAGIKNEFHSSKVFAGIK
jgi:hypothetical protein